MMTNTESTCPLCCAKDFDQIDALTRDQVRYIYKRRLGVDVDRIIDSDLALNQCRVCDLRFFTPMLVGDQSFYAKLQGFDWYYLKQKFEFTFTQNHVKPGMSVLEIGAGRGAFARHIPTATYAGLEFSSAAIEAASEAGVALVAETVESHAAHNPGRYDVVCTFQVLEHVSGVRSFLDAACECLRPGGILVVSVPSEDSFMGSEVNNPLNMPPHHVTRWSDAALRAIGKLLEIQLVTLQHEPLADMHVQPWASSIAHNGLLGFFRRKRSILDPLVETPPFRALAAPFRTIIERGVLRSAWRPAGHTVCAVYAK